MVCSETDLKRNHDEYLKFLQEKVSIARKALEDVMKASDGVDGNVAFSCDLCREEDANGSNGDD